MEIVRGESLNLIFKFLDKEQQPIDISTCKITALLRQGSHVSLSISNEQNENNSLQITSIVENQALITIPNYISANMLGTYIIEVRLTRNDNIVHILQSSKITVKNSIIGKIK